MKITTTKEIKSNKFPLINKWVAVTDIFEWEKKHPEDTFDDFLAELDYDRYQKIMEKYTKLSQP